MLQARIKNMLSLFRILPVTTEERVNDLVSRMTLQEKADQLLYTAPAIPRLGIPSYNWWNEALHGVARGRLRNSFSSVNYYR